MVFKPGTSVVEKDGNEHMADAVGYLIDFLFPITTEYDHSTPNRWAFTGSNANNINNNTRRWS